MATRAGKREESLPKRAFEWFAAAWFAFVTLPLVLLLAAMATISFRASPFFSQERIGLGGKRFRVVKIRSLYKTVSDGMPKYELTAESTTRYGRFIRRTHLDELPQLWLVLVGTMSLVGPRPEMPELAAGFSEEFGRLRSSMRPGCTGLWQISADSHRLITEAPEYDLAYVENASMRLDLWIVWRTVVQFFRPRTRPTLADVPRWALPSRTSPSPSTVPSAEAELGAGNPTDGHLRRVRVNGHELRTRHVELVAQLYPAPGEVASCDRAEQHRDTELR
jgi:lipopolysaccharide/colanic/teichoic acid biosynthesis glycosyltransferase